MATCPEDGGVANFLRFAAGRVAGLEAVNFIRGDANANGGHEITDAVRTFGFLFLGDPLVLECSDAADSNDSGLVDLADGIYTLNFLFTGGPPPPSPYPECAGDPTDDGLDCESFDPCASGGECMTVADLNAIARDLLPPEICLPPGIFGLSGALTVEICPEPAAGGCPEVGEPGCAIAIRVVDCELNRAKSEIVMHVEGETIDLPLSIAASGLENLCRIDAAFVVDARLPLYLASAPDGTLEIVDIHEPVLSSIDVELTTRGGVLCDAFAALEDHVVAVKLREVEATASRRVAEMREAFVGARICAPD